MTIMNYSDVQSQLTKGRSHLLLGNGFSIACDSRFSYGSLFDYVKKNGLPNRVLGVFEKLGTNNFEGVMRLLDDTNWMAHHYGLINTKDKVGSMMLEDLEVLKIALVSAVARTHPARNNDIPDEKKKQCAQFLNPYWNIFTTNYDLLLYWVEMNSLELLKGRDGFRSDVDDPESNFVVFQEHVGGNKGIFFIHGALHLYVKDGEVRKHTWCRKQKPLIETIQESLNEGQYPLFVAEGKANQKLEQIQRSGYLSYCLGKLERIENSLVVYGLSFGESDEHIAKVLACNKKLKKLYVGIYGDAKSPTNLEIQKNIESIKKRRDELIVLGRAAERLEVHYYDSSSAPVWTV